jgi:uncharacterized protein DUF5908
MPLEIRELVVKVTIEENAVQPDTDETRLRQLKQSIIRECVEEVLMKLENMQSR